VTLPSPSSAPTPVVPAPPAPPLEPVTFPLSWLLDHAGGPIKYRSLVEVAKTPGLDVRELQNLVLAHSPALILAAQQSADGTWNNSMLTVPSGRAEHFDGVGTIMAVRRLLEYGWDKDTPPLYRARRILFRLLAEDNDPDYLYELGAKSGKDEEVAKRARMLLREAAAAALAQAGYEGDPRLRGAATRILDRITAFLKSPLAEKPFVRVGNQHVLPPEASPPSMYVLSMLAYMPLFRTERHESMDLLYTYLTQQLPRQEAIQQVGDKMIPQPQFVLGDMLATRNVADDDIALAVEWLELMARLGFLRRNENWSKLFDRFLDERDREGVWHPRKGTAAVKSSSPFAWHMYPLEDSMAGDERWTDLTFRLGLIARLSGRPIEAV
jgi:TPR repeat protein